jgi:hypothetical protein
MLPRNRPKKDPIRRPGFSRKGMRDLAPRNRVILSPQRRVISPTSHEATTERLMIKDRAPSSKRRIAAALAGASLAGLVAACVAEPPPRAVVASPDVVVAMRPPPPPRVEAPPPPPNNVVAWVPGHWAWNGADYAWAPGRYVERPPRTARFEEGRWVQRNNGWVWVEGVWR